MSTKVTGPLGKLLEEQDAAMAERDLDSAVDIAAPVQVIAQLGGAGLDWSGRFLGAGR